ncbi:MAG: pilus assembly protein PilM [Nitrospinota bacterium]
MAGPKEKNGAPKVKLKKPDLKGILNKLKIGTKVHKLLQNLALILNIPIVNTFTGVLATPGSTKVIDLEQREDKFVLNCYEEIRPDQGADPFGPETAKKVGAVCKEKGLRARTAANLIVDKNFYLRQVDVPEMEKEEIMESLRFSERESIPFPIETASMDVFTLPEDSVDGQIKVRMAALDGKVVKKYNDFIRQTSLKHISIIPVSSALVAVLEESKIMDKSVPVPVISVGRSVTGIYVFDEGYIRFSRDVSIGTYDLIENIASEYEVAGEVVELTEEEAEEMKDYFGVPMDEDLYELGVKGVTGEMILEKIQPVLDKMITEFGRSIDYFKNEYRVADVPTAYLIGTAAHIKNLSKYLTDALGFEFKSYNPFDDFLVVEKPELEKHKERGSELTLTVGVALVQDRKLNLLPPDMRFSFARLKKRAAPVFLVLLFIILVMLINAGGIQYVKHLKTQIKNYETQIANLKAEQQAGGMIEDKIIEFKNDIKAVDTRMSIYPELKGRNIKWAEVYLEVSKLLPGDIALESIVISFSKPKSYAVDGSLYSQQLVISGMIRGRADTQIMALRDFLNKIQFSPYFEHASLISTGEEEGEGAGNMLNFEIASDLKGSS